jgi:hypothetical protein
MKGLDRGRRGPVPDGPESSSSNYGSSLRCLIEDDSALFLGLQKMIKEELGYGRRVHPFDIGECY